MESNTYQPQQTDGTITDVESAPSQANRTPEYKVVHGIGYAGVSETAIIEVHSPSRVRYELPA